MLTADRINEISRVIVDVAYHIHVQYGPGMRESFYARLLTDELRARGLRVDREVPISTEHNGKKYWHIGRIDVLVENEVVVEVKSVMELTPRDWKQGMTYLKASNRRLALLINFSAERIKDGTRRIVNGL